MTSTRPIEGSGTESAYTTFVGSHERPLRQAFTSLYGPELGGDATAEALAWAWEHWDEVQGMSNPGGYLFRVGQTRTRRLRRSAPFFPAVPAAEIPWIEPGLPSALSRLSEPQRVAVLLVHGHDWSHGAVASLLDIAPSTVATHVHRGLRRLRELLEPDR